MSQRSMSGLEDVNLADDAINDLIKEAETLMLNMPLDDVTAPDAGANGIGAGTAGGLTMPAPTTVHATGTNANPSATANMNMNMNVTTTTTTNYNNVSVDSIDIGGNFSIDDDDDEEEMTFAPTTSNANCIGNSGTATATAAANAHDDPLRAPTATTTTTTAATPPPPTTSSSNPSLAQMVFQELQQDDHPLSAMSLNTPTAPPAPNNNNASNSSSRSISINTGTSISTSNNINLLAPPTTSNTTTSSLGSTMSNIFQGGVMNQMGMGMRMGMGMSRNTGRGMGMGMGSEPSPSPSTSSSGMESFSKTTGLFASNLASLAQQGMEKMAAATAPMGGGGGPGSSPHLFSPSSAAGSSHNGHVHHQGGAVPPGPQQQAFPQLDTDQKRALLRKHVGELLEGEQVIMFLANLLHVSDTSGVNFVASQQQHPSNNTVNNNNNNNNNTSTVMWCCVMTYYRLILFSTADAQTIQPMEAPKGWDPHCWRAATPRSSSIKLLEIPLASMDRVEKTVYQASGSSYMGLVVYGKDCGRILRFTTLNYVDTNRAFESLNTYAFPGRRNLGYLFAFESKRREVQNSIRVDETSGQQGVTLPPTPRRFDATLEYPRLLQQTGITQPPWALWARVNANYQLSQSYPHLLVGPASLDETKPEALSVIRQCGAFRKAQRLPSMTWCGVGGASIWRSSQPKVGLKGNRSHADELYVRHIIESARGANAMAEPPPVYPRGVLEQLTGDYSSGSGGGSDWLPEPGCGLKILDLRPRAAAIANRTGGYGYENTSNYLNTTLQFCNIQNIHAVRDSYEKLCSICNNPSTADVHWNSLVEDTKWLSHIRTVLAASWETAYWVHVWRIPILVHCSHGWDRTSQTVCISQLLLDSYYRTRHGFSVLVEKDFMSFGHPFHLRSAHGEGRSDAKNGTQSNDENQISPIFLQFLDCVYQLVALYPNAFEFNTQYLLDLSFHVYSCRFGNMLCDTEREREAMAAIRQRTYSVWDYLETKHGHVNPNYSKTDDAILMPLPTLLRNVRVWKERHFAFSPKASSMVF